MTAKIGVLNISDRASAGVYEDTPGKACVALLREWIATPFEVDYKIIPDERAVIETELRRMADESGCCLVVTTGGTGIAPRDVTPEATRAVCERLLEGVAERMRAEGARKTPLAALSRGVCGIRGKSMILNTPGSPRGAVESLEAVIDLLPHALQLLSGDTEHA